MKAKLKIPPILSIVLAVLLVLLLVYARIPDYDTPALRKQHLQQSKYNIEILSEETFGDYIVCLSRNGTMKGYALFKNTFGKCCFDHARHGDHGAKGYLTQDGKDYLILVTYRPNATSFDIVYRDLDGDQELHRERVEIDDELTITPLWTGNFDWSELIFYDAEGNRI